jgi:hypothetical protein
MIPPALRTRRRSRYALQGHEIATDLADTQQYDREDGNGDDRWKHGLEALHGGQHLELGFAEDDRPLVGVEAVFEEKRPVIGQIFLRVPLPVEAPCLMFREPLLYGRQHLRGDGIGAEKWAAGLSEHAEHGSGIDGHAPQEIRIELSRHRAFVGDGAHEDTGAVAAADAAPYDGLAFTQMFQPGIVECR